MTFAELRRRKARLEDRALLMCDKAESERRDFTNLEQGRFEMLLAEIQGLRLEMDRRMIADDFGQFLARLRRGAKRALTRAMQANPHGAVRSAFHESGHCVMAVLDGVGVQRVYLQSDGRRGVGGCTETRFEPTKAVLAAGLAAERIEEPSRKTGWTGANNIDYGMLSVLFRREGLRAEGWAHQALAEADHRLREAWPAVQALASALVKEGALGGVEAERIVLQALPSHLRDGASTQLNNAEGRERAVRARKTA